MFDHLGDRLRRGGQEDGLLPPDRFDVVLSWGSAAYVNHGAAGDVFFGFAEYFSGDWGGFSLA